MQPAICEYCKKRKATQSAELVLGGKTFNLRVCARCARRIAKTAKEEEAYARGAEYRAERKAELDAECQNSYRYANYL